jgi:hypothetical protein
MAQALTPSSHRPHPYTVDPQESPPSPQLLQRVEEMLQQKQEKGAFDFLFAGDLMKELPQETRTKLLEWADDMDDDAMFRYFIERNLASQELLNDIVRGCLESDSLGEIVDAINTGNKFVLLTPENRQEVLKWLKTHRGKNK